MYVATTMVARPTQIPLIPMVIEQSGRGERCVEEYFEEWFACESVIFVNWLRTLCFTFVFPNYLQTGHTISTPDCFVSASSAWWHQSPMSCRLLSWHNCKFQYNILFFVWVFFILDHRPWRSSQPWAKHVFTHVRYPGRLFLESENPEKPISMYINSPGGSVTAGLGIYDTMQVLPLSICTITHPCLAQISTILFVLCCKQSSISGLHASMWCTLSLCLSYERSFCLWHHRILLQWK